MVHTTTPYCYSLPNINDLKSGVMGLAKRAFRIGGMTYRYNTRIFGRCLVQINRVPFLQDSRMYYLSSTP
jgi:hypothetical protein